MYAYFRFLDYSVYIFMRYKVGMKPVDLSETIHACVLGDLLLGA